MEVIRPIVLVVMLIILLLLPLGFTYGRIVRKPKRVQQEGRTKSNVNPRVGKPKAPPPPAPRPQKQSKKKL